MRKVVEVPSETIASRGRRGNARIVAFFKILESVLLVEGGVASFETRLESTTPETCL